MIPPRPRPRIVVRAADRRLRALLADRLSAAGDLEVRQADGTPDDAPLSGSGRKGKEPDAVVEEYREEAPLTTRELEVLGLLAGGMANKQIADRLGVTAHTAKFHVESVLHKLSASNRAEAVMEGVRRGLLGL